MLMILLMVASQKFKRSVLMCLSEYSQFFFLSIFLYVRENIENMRPLCISMDKNKHIFFFSSYLSSREWKLRENLVDNEDDDTISFTLKQRFIFRPELSNGLSGNEEIFFPNLIIFGTIMTVKREREAFLPTVIKV